MIGLDPDCHYGDHTWQGGGICVRCYKRLRCACGRFIREDAIDQHVAVCLAWKKYEADERDRLEEHA